jgi:hypothetical protein
LETRTVGNAAGDAYPTYAILADRTDPTTAATAIITALETRTVRYTAGDTYPTYAILADGTNAATAATAIITALEARTVRYTAGDAQPTYAILADRACVIAVTAIVCICQQVNAATRTIFKSRLAIQYATYVQGQGAAGDSGLSGFYALAETAGCIRVWLTHNATISIDYPD